jgi:flavin reductase (DIM6/NTAB) family NADH-FMN oxidoreductase RutF
MGAAARTSTGASSEPPLMLIVVSPRRHAKRASRKGQKLQLCVRPLSV